MPIIQSEPLFVVGEKSTLDRFCYNELQRHTVKRIVDASELASIELQFKSLEERQIFVAIGRNDARKGTPIQLYEKYILDFVKNLKALYADRKFLNICYVRPRYHKNGVYEDEQMQARYIGATYQILLFHFPQTIMFSQDSRDPWVSNAYRGLFFKMHKHRPIQEAIKAKTIEEHVKHEANPILPEPVRAPSPIQPIIVPRPASPVPAPRLEFKTLYLYIYCRDLPNKGMGTIDPYVKISSSDDRVKIGEKYGYAYKTNTVKNSIEPDYYMTPLEIQYHDLLNPLTFTVKDDDPGKDDTVGTLNCVVGGLLKLDNKNIFGYNKFTLSQGGEIYIQALNEAQMEDKVGFNVSAKGLPKMDGIFGKCDPYFRIVLRNLEGDKFVPIYSSDTIKSTLNPNWGMIKLPIARFGVGGLELLKSKRVIFKLYDWDNVGDDDYIGASEVEMKHVLDGHECKIRNAAKTGSKAIRGDLIFGPVNES